MRVITGTAKGRRLMSPDGNDVRPTTDATKEGIFSVLQFDVEGRRVLDLFAGSGQLGIEALSRGAAGADFVDSSPKSVAMVRENVSRCGFGGKAKVVQSRAEDYLLRTGNKYDIAFLDPPYGKGILQGVLPSTALVMKPSGVIVCEHPLGEAMPEEVNGFSVQKKYKYGKTEVTFYRALSDELR